MMTDSIIPQNNFKYYDITRTLTHNAFLNFVIGERGTGKTYSAKKRILKKYKKFEHRFIFMKRSNDDIRATAPRFFNDFCNEEQDIMFVNNVFYIGFPQPDNGDEGESGKIEQVVENTEKDVKIKTSIKGKPGFIYEEFGYAIALRTPQKLKGTTYENVKTVLFDEFIDYDDRYLHNEIDRILDVMETVGRMNDDLVFVGLANANNRTYIPLFDQLGLPKVSGFEPGKIYKYKKGQVLIQYLKNEDYQKAKAETRLGKVSVGTDYYETMIKNKSKEKNYEDLIMDEEEMKFKGRMPFFFVNGDKYYAFAHSLLLEKKGIGYIFEINRLPASKHIYAIDDNLQYKKFVASGIIKDMITQNKLKFDKVQTADLFFNYLGGKL